MVQSKQTSLQFHKLYRIWVWFQLAVSLYNLIRDAVSGVRSATPYILILVCFECMVFLIFLLYCVTLWDLSELGYLFLFLYWGARAAEYLTLVVISWLLTGRTGPLGGLIETMIAGTLIIFYYQRRKRYFFMKKKVYSAETANAVTDEKSVADSGEEKKIFPENENEEDGSETSSAAQNFLARLRQKRLAENKIEEEEEDSLQEPVMAAYVYCQKCGKKTPLSGKRCMHCKSLLQTGGEE